MFSLDPLNPSEETALFEAATAAGLAWSAQRAERPPTGRADAVIAWVDGADPAHQAKREAALAGRETVRRDRNGIEAKRFIQADELRFCLRSIRAHAPWIRVIWVVTDRQVPAWLDRERAVDDRIRFVDHLDIFPDPDVLPSFNSLSIETCLWRIPGLAERFLYFNDDMLLTRATQPGDFFTADGVVLRGSVKPIAQKGYGLHGNVVRNGARLAGFRDSFFSIKHAPYAQLRSIWAMLDRRIGPALQRNAVPRFRSADQFGPIPLHGHIALREGKAVFQPVNDVVNITDGMIQDDDIDALRRRVSRLARGRAVAACINDFSALAARIPELPEAVARAAGHPLASERLVPASG